MYPFLFETDGPTGPLRIPMYGILILLAFTAAFALVNNRARKIGIQPERMIPVYIAAAVGGLVGARLLYAIAVNPMETLRNPLTLVTAAGGLAFYGGLLGGAAGVFGIARYMNLPGWKIADIVAPALVLGLGVGRIGCLLAGCCHGAPAHVSDGARPLLPESFAGGQFWLDGSFPFVTAEFHGGMGRLLDVPLYPTQLWSALAGLGIATVAMAMWKHRRFDGQIAAFVLIVEPVFRFLIESFRADERGYALTFEVSSLPAWLPPGFTRAGSSLPDAFHPSAAVIGLTTSQFLGLLIIAAGMLILVLRYGSGVAPEKELEEEL